MPGINIVGGATGFFVGEATAIPVSHHVMNRETLTAKKEAAIVVLSDEALEAGDPAVEELFRQDLVRAAAEVDDLVFLSDDVGTASTPAGIASSLGSPASIASLNDIGQDVDAALGAFLGNLLSASWIMHPRLAARIGLLSNGVGLGADCHALGGRLAGIEVLTSQQSPIDQILLVDGSGLLMVDQGIEFATSGQAMIEMSSVPAGEGFSPTTASAGMVSMFQNGLHAIKLIRRVNWSMRRAGGVVIISNDDYTGAS
jgi:HK97 family phage major capsid protein